MYSDEIVCKPTMISSASFKKFKNYEGVGGQNMGEWIKERSSRKNKKTRIIWIDGLVYENF